MYSKYLVLILVLYYFLFSFVQNSKNMATIKTTLKTPKKLNSVIWFVISDTAKVHLQITSGITINTKQWSKKNSCILSNHENAVSLNAFLKTREKLIFDIYLSYKSKNIVPTAKQINDEIKALQVDKDIETTTFWDLWDIFIHQKRNNVGKAYNKKMATLKSHLQAFEKHEKLSLHLDSITQNTLSMLESFFYEVKSLNTQTNGKYIKFFKTFLKWAYDNKYTSNHDYTLFKVAQQPDVLKVALTEEELQKIRIVDLENKNYLKNVRQLFLLSCYTGLRYSDYKRIRVEHLKYDNGAFLSIRQQKTNDFVNIPLNTETEFIVNEIIKGNVKPISNQKMNDYVKELCKIAGIDEPFEVHTFKGKLKSTTTKLKYELVTSHTGRRTFATYLLNKGLPAEIIMKFTGHKDYTSFMKYVNISQNTQMNMIRNVLQNTIRVA
jgi:integrase